MLDGIGPAPLLGRCPQIVGRDAEQSRLAQAWQRARGGQPTWLVVRGEAGIGKTRLITNLVGQAESAGHTVVLQGGCLPLLDGRVAYAPLLEALRPLAERPSDALDREVRSRLQSLLFSGPYVERATGRATDREFGQAQLFDAVRAALAAAAETAPTLLVLEDLHWSDLSTMQLLAALARTLRRQNPEARLLVVLSCRTGGNETTEELEAFLVELSRSPDCTMIDLESLGQQDVGRMLDLLDVSVSDRAAREKVIRRADGNPFFVEELSRVGPDEFPETLRGILTLRVRTLTASAMSVARTAAAIGPTTHHDLLVAALDLDERDILDGLRTSVSAGVLISEGDSYTFRHALLQEIIYDELLPGERRVLHSHVADALETQPAARTFAAQLAHHYLLAQDRQAAIRWSLIAGEEAERVNALSEALAHYLQAQLLIEQLTEPAADGSLSVVLQRAGYMAHALGRHEQAVDLLQRAFDELPANTEPVARALLLVRLGDALSAFDMERAEPVFDQAYQLARGAEPSTVAAYVLTRTPHALLMAGRRTEEAAQRSSEAVEMARTTGAEVVEAEALVQYAIAQDLSGQVDLAEESYQRAAGLYRRNDDPGLLLWAGNYVDFLTVHGEFEKAIAVGADAIEFGRRFGLASAWFRNRVLLYNIAIAAFEIGRWDEAQRYSDECRSLADPLASELDRNIRYAGVHVRLLLGRGKLHEAQALLPTAQSLQGMSADIIRVNFEQLVEAAVLAHDEGAAFRHAIACEAALQGAVDSQSTGRLLLMALRALADSADRARTLQQRDALDRLIDQGRQLGELARASGATKPPATDLAITHAPLSAQWAAEWLRLHGHEDAQAWARAADEWRSINRPQLAAYCLMRAGQAALRTAHHRHLAITYLSESATIARDLGAKPISDEVEGTASRARIRLPVVPAARKPGSTKSAALPYGLTQREFEILALLAEGLTNSQIGKQLYISPNTVGIHVSRVLRKLEVSTRTQAAAIAHAAGIHPAHRDDVPSA